MIIPIRTRSRPVPRLRHPVPIVPCVGTGAVTREISIVVITQYHSPDGSCCMRVGIVCSCIQVLTLVCGGSDVADLVVGEGLGVAG